LNITGISEALRKADRHLDKFYAEQRPPCTTAQLAILKALQKQGQLIQRHITAASGVDRSTLAHVVRTLEAAGLVTVDRGDGVSTDARATFVSITAEGRKAIRLSIKAMEIAELNFLELVPQANRTGFQHAVGTLLALPATLEIPRRPVPRIRLKGPR